ncbi:ABC transporter permease [Anaerocolumna cellulosilytica]|uniref:ABC transporter permease n=1 Tax=Anaerocolumna cellulosilytica TaxID=433286 RepID=A0A6S6QPQ1_9FIRM|nr:ABC transporter permease [Anaerocolumna cellulosilytica]MBB5196137.1 putative ABC transport system permease protein [Anaerocolumna cellulosilytica]BCJ92544.1 ABC transporter permease [Anaerocolumna cellulosilytica]
MKLRQTLKVVWNNIVGNRMRSFLTMLGMIIGVASVIMLVSVMQGFSNQMVESYSSMGINNITVSLKGRNGNLMFTEDDMYQYAKEHSDNLLGASPNVSTDGSLNKKSNKVDYVTITGIDESYISIMKKELQLGHNITYSDISIKNKVCIIGAYINNKLFNGNAQIGDTIRLNGEEFVISGILVQSSDGSEWSEDNAFYIPYTTAMRLNGISSVSSYTFFVKDSNLVTLETTNLQDFLFKTYRDSKLYKVSNYVDMLTEINVQMGILTTVIAGIAGISLLVAGIGIMNIMLVSVSERTREIGIRKSLGAKHKDIMRQFVLEAAATSSIGGLLGILLGGAGAISAGNLIKLNATPSPNVVLLSFGISAGIGILFGYLPARKAAKLNPIDALRNE